MVLILGSGSFASAEKAVSTNWVWGYEGIRPDPDRYEHIITIIVIIINTTIVLIIIIGIIIIIVIIIIY
jgi:hypothetical protein